MDKLTELMQRYPQLEGCKASIEAAMELLRNMYNGGGKLLACGNGGSCADCEHIVGELMKSFLIHRPLTEAVKGIWISCLGRKHRSFILVCSGVFPLSACPVRWRC